MIDHLPFLHSRTHSDFFHPCDSFILAFVLHHFRSIFRTSSLTAQCAGNMRSIILKVSQKAEWETERERWLITCLFFILTSCPDTSGLILIFFFAFIMFLALHYGLPNAILKKPRKALIFEYDYSQMISFRHDFKQKYTPKRWDVCSVFSLDLNQLLIFKPYWGWEIHILQSLWL